MHWQSADWWNCACVVHRNCQIPYIRR